MLGTALLALPARQTLSQLRPMGAKVQRLLEFTGMLKTGKVKDTV